MAWCRVGDKLLSERMSTKIYDNIAHEPQWVNTYAHPTWCAISFVHQIHHRNIVVHPANATVIQTKVMEQLWFVQEVNGLGWGNDRNDSRVEKHFIYRSGNPDIGVLDKCLNPLQWRHNERDGVSNHLPHDCLLNGSFRRRSKKTPKLRVTGLCTGNSPVTGEFPTQRVSNAANVSIWWPHHACWFLSLPPVNADLSSICIVRNKKNPPVNVTSKYNNFLDAITFINVVCKMWAFLLSGALRSFCPLNIQPVDITPCLIALETESSWW